MKLLLIVRNRIASLSGLDAPTASEILHVEIKDRYVVGETIGVWPIFALRQYSRAWTCATRRTANATM